MDGKIGFRILAGLVLIAAIAGIAYFAFQAGVAQGSPVTIEVPPDGSAPYGPYGYPMRFHHPFGFGFGCLGLLIPVFLIFLALKAFRFMFWGARGWGHHGHGYGPWGMRGEGGPPQFFEDWHKRAHGEQPAEPKKD
jgi:hypothetical protein